MSVKQLSIYNFRNLVNTKIDFHAELNFITGANGSGKSSILESIFFISHGKSFRTVKAETIVAYNTTEFVVNIKDDRNRQLGISRSLLLPQLEIKVNGSRIKKLSELAKNVAVQIVTPESFKLFFGGPKERRRFIDLGLFHVKHDFSAKWRHFSKLHKQRNACLRKKVSDKELAYWTEHFCEYSEIMAEYRFNYVETLKKELTIWLEILLPDLANRLMIHYSKGWINKKKLADLLIDSSDKDRQFGYSTIGAHKFDIKFTLNKQPLEVAISRGQQKLFLLALTFAQSKMIARVKQLKPILLIDDVGAELDQYSRTALAIAIKRLDCQVIITAIENSVLAPLVASNENYKMFHVKQGEISAE